MQTWNNILATMAKTWAARCVWEHGQPSNVDTSGLSTQAIGQNLHMTGGSTVNLVAAIQSWYDEKSGYDYDSNTQCCGHYKQVKCSS